MIELLIIGSGGFFGAVSRYLLSGMVHRMFPESACPAGTFTVNIIGCLLIGMIAGLADTRNILTNEMRLLVLVGFLGSFTTFSTYAHESLHIFKTGTLANGMINLFLHVTFGVLAVWLGQLIARNI